MKLLLNLIIFISFIGLINCYGESDSEGNPNYLERESHNLLNVVRMFPIQYKYDFMAGYGGLDSILTSKFPSVSPLYYDNSYNRLTKAHSFDMYSNKCFSHNDCNGTEIGTRFKNWPICSGSWAENIAAGTATGISTNNLLICEKSMGSTCPTDDESGSIGHRRNIMGNYKYVGVGNYGTYYTQDFFSQICDKDNIPTGPIHSGFHTYYPTNETLFLVTFYGNNNSSRVVEKMNLVFSDYRINIPRRYGNNTFAVFAHRELTFVDCQQYYFEAFTTEGEVFRYPDVGYLQTVNSKSKCLGYEASSNTFIIPPNSEETTDPNDDIFKGSSSVLNLNLFIVVSLLFSVLLI